MTSLAKSSGAVTKLLTLSLMMLVALFPVYWMIRTAFGGSLFEIPPLIIPDQLSLAELGRIFRDQPTATWLANSMIVAVATVVVGLLISVNAAYNLSRFRTRLNLGVGYLILTAQMLPGAVLILPIFIVFLELRLVNQLLGLVIANVLFALPLSVWMLKGFFDGTPRELEEAAMVDGTSRLGAFYRVILPVAMPGIVAVGVFLFMSAWAEFFFARTLVGTKSTEWVMTIGLTAFEDDNFVNKAGLMAAVVVYIVPPVVLFFLARQSLLKGLSAGGVKG